MAARPNIEGDFNVLVAGYDYEFYMESLILNIKGRDSEYNDIL